jgi:hypothetical protein
LLAGVWLTLSPSALGYGDPDVPFGGVRNETVVGITMAVVARIRILTPAASACSRLFRSSRSRPEGFACPVAGVAGQRERT